MRTVKVLVVGVGEAGKSTLIRALSPHAMNLEVNGRTVAMDHAMVDLGGARVSLVGVPGQSRFRPVREALMRGAGGAIWVHRAGDTVDPDTADLVSHLDAVGAPHIVYVNFHDGFDTLDPWTPPHGCVQPWSVVAGNLMEPGDSLNILRGELLELVQTPRKEPSPCPHRSNR